MLNKFKLLSLIVLLALASSTLAVIHGLKSRATGLTSGVSQTSSQKTEAKDDDDLPVFDPSAPTTKDEKKAARRKVKGQRYSNPSFPISDLGEDNNITHIAEGEPRSALPVKQSNLIIIGEVADAEAVLSNDRSSLYSEFTIRVDEVLKQDSTESLAKGDYIFVERLGGRLKLPSGKFVVERVSNTKMPRAGRKYVFFLIKHPDNSIFIHAGYELAGDKVIALDNNLTTRYNGALVRKLLADLSLALSDNSTALTTPN